MLKSTLAGVGIITFILFLIFGPFMTIWGLNTLFKLDIPYTLETYFAVVALSIFFNVRLDTK